MIFMIIHLNLYLSCYSFAPPPLQGSECEYRHSEVARVNPRDCYYWLNGNCTNRKCTFRHPVSLFLASIFFNLIINKEITLLVTIISDGLIYCFIFSRLKVYLGPCQLQQQCLQLLVITRPSRAPLAITS